MVLSSPRDSISHLLPPDGRECFISEQNDPMECRTIAVQEINI